MERPDQVEPEKASRSVATWCRWVVRAVDDPADEVRVPPETNEQASGRPRPAMHVDEICDVKRFQLEVCEVGEVPGDNCCLGRVYSGTRRKREGRCTWGDPVQ